MTKIILIVSFISFPLFTVAQNELLVSAGFNFSNVTSIDSPDPDGTLGINTGIVYKWYINDVGWSLIPGLQFSQEGFQDQRLNYLNAPLLIGFDFTKDFNVSTGIQFSFLLTDLDDPEDVIFRENFSIVVGFAYDLNDRYQLGLRLDNGVKNIINKPDLFILDDARTFTIQVFFSINLIKKQ